MSNTLIDESLKLLLARCMVRFEYVSIAKKYFSITQGFISTTFDPPNAIHTFIHLKSLMPFYFSLNL